MRVPNKLQFRRLWFTVHKWLGLALGLPVLIIFLTGAVLVWKDSVDDLLHPQRRVDAAASEAPNFYVAAAGRIVAPDERIANLTYPTGNGPVVVSTIRAGERSAMQGHFRYFLHPVTGALLDRASLDFGPMRWVHVLHGSLLLGRLGARLVGLVALILLLSACSGLWLWWPTKGAFIRGLRWRRTQSINANLHHQAGYLVALPLGILSVTGATITFPGTFVALSGDAAAANAELARDAAPPLSQSQSSLAHVVAAAGSPRPRAIVTVVWPTTVEPRWKIVLKDSTGSHAFAVDDHTGHAYQLSGSSSESASRLMRRVHDGTGMPLIWQIIIFVTGLLGPTLAVTGGIMWLKGQVRHGRMRQQRAKKAAHSHRSWS